MLEHLQALLAPLSALALRTVTCVVLLLNLFSVVCVLLALIRSDETTDGNTDKDTTKARAPLYKRLNICALVCGACMVVGIAALFFSPSASGSGYLGFFALELIGCCFLAAWTAPVTAALLGMPLAALAWLAFCGWMAWSFAGGRAIDFAHPQVQMVRVEGYQTDEHGIHVWVPGLGSRVPSAALRQELNKAHLESHPPNKDLPQPIAAYVLSAPESEYLYLPQERSATPAATRNLWVSLVCELLLLLCGLVAAITLPSLPKTPPKSSPKAAPMETQP